MEIILKRSQMVDAYLFEQLIKGYATDQDINA